MSSSSTAPERNWAPDSSDGEATGFTRLPYVPAPAVAAMTFPSTSAPRPTSPAILPRRFNSARESKTPDSSMFSNGRARLSLQTKPGDKGKAPLRGDAQGNEASPSMNGYHPFATYDFSGPSSSSNARKHRNSFLGAASDALSLTFGRRQRPIIRQAPMPIILPDVIEISAPPPDQEVEERNRLREMAAQAIGISPFIIHPDSHSQEESTEDEDEDALRTPADTSELRHFGDSRNSESAPDIRNKSFLDTSSTSTANAMRLRSGSVASHSRHNSFAFTPVPPYPTNVLSLNPFLACSGYFPKYTQPSSLRRFALSSKLWKTRYIVLSAPSNPLSKNPTVSYLHLFKSSGPDDKELERLEISTDSAVFVADEEVGGRRNVIRIKGFEVVPGKEGGKGLHEAIWHLHIVDPVESQKWISTIKSAILGQRTVAAGLAIPITPTGPEPRGDLDVLLKIRAQGQSHTSPRSSTVYDPQPPKSPTTEHHYASSISSQSVRSQATSTPKPVSGFKGLFSSRPRSASRATSVESERERDYVEDSFTSMGNSLMGRLRSNTPDTQSNVTTTATLKTPTPQKNSLPFTRYSASSEQRKPERKVLSERQPEQWVNREGASTPTGTGEKNRANRALSLGALSLQPPPRRRWASLRPADPNEDNGSSFFNNSPVTTTVFGSRPSYERAETEPPSSPLDFSSFTMTSHEARPRAPSLQSVSTYNSENTRSIDRSSTSTKRTSSTNRRWSRQLPQRLTPPSGPPPAIPAAASITQLNVHPYVQDRPPSVNSNVSGQSQQSVISTLPSFSKRNSTSSVNSASTTHNTVASCSSARTRASMPPPPRPAPTSALPLTPDQEAKSGPTPASTKTTFRNSVAQRALRLSMITPKPPPSGNLPPRPDEVEFTSNKKHHRRSSSSGRNQLLDTIPEPSKHPYVTSTTSPFPPPVGPLPPTPRGGSGGDTVSNQPTPVSRHSSLKNRLRILSSPAPSSGPSPLPLTRPNTSDATTPTATPLLTHTQFTPSVPSTPSAEKMMTFPNDFQSFLQMNTTPTLANIVPSRITDYSSEGLELVEVLDEVTPLAPPPRRGSLIKPLSLLPVEVTTTTTTGTTPTTANSVDTTIDTAATFRSLPESAMATAGTFSSTPESAGTDGSHKMVISRSGSGSTQDYDDQYSPIGRQEGDDEDDVDDDDDSGSLRAKATPTMPTMMAPDPIHAFSLSPPSSVVSLGLVSS